MLTAVSLFSGCGGFDFGASNAGVRVIWANDVDYRAERAYKCLLPDTEFIHSDVRKVKNFPEADILIGCYPCTGFSLAARRRWRERTERDLKDIAGNFLYKEFIRAIDTVKPKYLFIENVGGMKSAEDGWFFNQQIEGLEAKGFVMKTNLMNSENFGLAQSRKRIFLVGVRNDIAEAGFEYHFPKGTHGDEASLPVKSMRDVITNVVNDLAVDVCDKPFHGHYLTRNRKRLWENPSYTIVATDSHIPLHPSGEPMVNIGKDKWSLQGEVNRRLSWKECAAIQGFPIDRFNFDTNLEGKYKVIGNAVPPHFGYAIIKSVVEFEDNVTLPKTFEQAHKTRSENAIIL